MREVRLYRPENGGSPHLHKVMDELCRITSQQHKIYRTYPKDGEKGHCFITTSKDIHLFLGQMFDEGLVSFANLLLEEFRGPSPVSELLITDPKNGKGMLATLPFYSDQVGSIIHLAPAH